MQGAPRLSKFARPLFKPSVILFPRPNMGIIGIAIRLKSNGGGGAETAPLVDFRMTVRKSQATGTVVIARRQVSPFLSGRVDDKAAIVDAVGVFIH